MTDHFEWLPDWLSNSGQDAEKATSGTRSRGSSWSTTLNNTAQEHRSHESLQQIPSTSISDKSAPIPLSTFSDATPSSRRTGSSDSPRADGLFEHPPVRILDVPAVDTTVNRKLTGLHIFMIVINTTVGTGFYWRGGQILELGGPLAVPLAFFSVGMLAWAVMQCITEMLFIWPIPGALPIFVSEFVDQELGIAVGVTYWLVYSMEFSTLFLTSTDELRFSPQIGGNKGVLAGVVYLCIPVFMVLVNMLKVEIFGLLEVITGTIKILILVVMVIFLIVINRQNQIEASINNVSNQYWNHPTTSFEKEATSDWSIALLMCMSTATFVYLGVEVVAASALEAEWPNYRKGTDDDPKNDSRKSSKPRVFDSTVKFSAMFLPAILTIIYTFSGVLLSLDIPRDECWLPRPSWLLDKEANPKCSSPKARESFAAMASKSGIPHLSEVFKYFLVFSCLTCASTNLYIASRTLFGLASRLEGAENLHWHLRVFAWFGKTNRQRIPLRALIFSALAFCWIPFLQLINGIGPSDTTAQAVDSQNKFGQFTDGLSQITSAMILIVWACECLAFIRYYHCISQHRDYIVEENVSQVQRWNEKNFWAYPYRSHGQPFVAYMALAGCAFLLFVANGAAVWSEFHLLPFLTAYVPIIVFLGLWVLLKLDREASWSFVDLSDPRRVVEKLRDLNYFRSSVTQG